MSRPGEAEALLGSLEQALAEGRRGACSTLSAELAELVPTLPPAAACALLPRLRTAIQRAESILEELRQEVARAGSGQRAIQLYRRR